MSISTARRPRKVVLFELVAEAVERLGLSGLLAAKGARRWEDLPDYVQAEFEEIDRRLPR